jgi:hypothetical protein
MKRSFDDLPSDLPVPLRIRPALAPLLEAVDYAQQTQCSYWEFAVEAECLFALGLTRNDFRWLVKNHLVEHQREVTLESDDGRAFRPTGDLMFPEGTCFVLTNKGIGLFRECMDSTKVASNPTPLRTELRCTAPDVLPSMWDSGSTPRIQAICPKWDADRRLLTFQGEIVKHFKWVAENQEAILNVFEEEGWPCRIDDPLKPTAEQDPKRRLSDTIKCLNRKQFNSLIHFRGDGTGEGVVWEVVQRHLTGIVECDRA